MSSRRPRQTGLMPKQRAFLTKPRQMRGAAAYRRGLWAEALCRLILRLKGYRIVAIREKTPQGEIDFIALRGRTLAFVEVKARPDETAVAEAVSPRQQARLSRAAMAYLARHPQWADKNIRFDVMQVLPWRWPRHLPDAFRAISSTKK